MVSRGRKTGWDISSFAPGSLLRKAWAPLEKHGLDLGVRTSLIGLRREWLYVLL